MQLTSKKGTGDNFFKQKQLLPEKFAEAATASGNAKRLNIRYQDVCIPISEQNANTHLRRDTIIPTSSSPHSPQIT